MWFHWRFCVISVLCDSIEDFVLYQFFSKHNFLMTFVSIRQFVSLWYFPVFVMMWFSLLCWPQQCGMQYCVEHQWDLKLTKTPHVPQSGVSYGMLLWLLTEKIIGMYLEFTAVGGFNPPWATFKNRDWLINIQFGIWLSNSIHINLSDLITHPCPNCNILDE